MILPECGKSGQVALKQSSVLIVGAGGLGCPAIAYLAGAGVGCLGIVDGDFVDVSNLHRQILHTNAMKGRLKVDSAAKYIGEINPSVSIKKHGRSLDHTNVFDIIKDYDIVLDCTDNQKTRYLISDTCVCLNIPLISGAALKTEGQLAVYHYRGGPCYRCLFPTPTPANNVQSCGEAGVLGPVVGIIGVLQALECIKLILDGINQATITSNEAKTYMPSLTLFSAFGSPQWRSVQLRQKKQSCIACGSRPEITRDTIQSGHVDYRMFCGLSSGVSDLLHSYERIEASDLLEKDKLKHNVILDVRDCTQFEITHLDQSINVPLQALDEYYLEDHHESVLVVCRMGNDSQEAVRKLQARYPKREFRDLKGGLQSFASVSPGFPIY